MVGDLRYWSAEKRSPLRVLPQSREVLWLIRFSLAPCPPLAVPGHPIANAVKCCGSAAACLANSVIPWLDKAVKQKPQYSASGRITLHSGSPCCLCTPATTRRTRTGDQGMSCLALHMSSPRSLQLTPLSGRPCSPYLPNVSRSHLNQRPIRSPHSGGNICHGTALYRRRPGGVEYRPRKSPFSRHYQEDLSRRISRAAH